MLGYQIVFFFLDHPPSPRLSCGVCFQLADTERFNVTFGGMGELCLSKTLNSFVLLFLDMLRVARIWCGFLRGVDESIEVVRI